MVNCIKCDKQDPKAKFCGHCGKSIGFPTPKVKVEMLADAISSTVKKASSPKSKLWDTLIDSTHDAAVFWLQGLLVVTIILVFYIFVVTFF